MAVKKKHYKYNYNFGDKDIEIIETDYCEWLNEALNKTCVFINNLGVYKFYMYSDSKDNVDTFLYQISEILSDEMNAASHLYQLASGRFNAFDSFWKEYDKRYKIEEEEQKARVKKMKLNTSKKGDLHERSVDKKSNYRNGKALL